MMQDTDGWLVEVSTEPKSLTHCARMFSLKKHIILVGNRATVIASVCKVGDASVFREIMNWSCGHEGGAH
jgi:hypothetical protein